MSLLNSIWLLYFVNAFQSSILYNLLPFVTSAFESHALLNVIYIVANAMSAAIYIPLAQILDVWGRAEGFLIMTVFATLGLVLLAACNGLPAFCAAYVCTVFYAVNQTPSSLMKHSTGLLQYRIWRHDILRGCHYS